MCDSVVQHFIYFDKRATRVYLSVQPSDASRIMTVVNFLYGRSRIEANAFLENIRMYSILCVPVRVLYSFLQIRGIVCPYIKVGCS